MITHEQYTHSIRDAVLATADLEPAEREQLAETKLTYGIGDGTYRGVTHFQRWVNGSTHDFVEIAASAEESYVQLAGTTIHELAHVLAGSKAGHGAEWRKAAERLGLRRAKAAGQRYMLAQIHPVIRVEAASLAIQVNDGQPAFGQINWLNWLATLGTISVRGCSAGQGTRGGKSRGKGSGSRLRLWQCQCEPKPVKVRVASDDFQATCKVCGADFAKVEKKG